IGGDEVLGRRAQGPQDRLLPVDVPEHEGVGRVLLAQVTEPAGLETGVRGRLVEPPDAVTTLERPGRPPRPGHHTALAAVDPLVLDREAAAAGAHPPARAGHDDAVELEGVVLDRVHAVRESAPELAYRRPPVVVVAAEQDLPTGQGGDVLEVEEGVL